MEELTFHGPLRLSVILPVHNGEPYLAGQLNSVASQQCSFIWELIVVDNASTDASAEIARSFDSRIANLRVISESRKGKSFALNTGRDAALGENFVLVDADDQIGPSYLECMVAALEHYELVCSTMDTTLLNPPWGREQVLPGDRLVEFLDHRLYIPGGLLGLRASAWQRIGDFATDLSVAEDVDFTWRAQYAGFSMGMASGAVQHVRRPTESWDNWRKARSYGQAHVALFVRHRNRGMPRRGFRAEIGHVWYAIRALVRHQEHWQWSVAWHLGLVSGHLEGSLRHHVWYP